MKISILISGLLLNLVSCSSENGGETNFIAKPLSDMPINSFRFPESLNKSLLIAAFTDGRDNSNCFILYTDSEKKSVYKLSSQNNLEIKKENLKTSGYNTFKNTGNSEEYFVNAHHVVVCPLIVNNNISLNFTSAEALSFEFKREQL